MAVLQLYVDVNAGALCYFIYLGLLRAPISGFPKKFVVSTSCPAVDALAKSIRSFHSESGTGWTPRSPAGPGNQHSRRSRCTQTVAPPVDPAARDSYHKTGDNSSVRPIGVLQKGTQHGMHTELPTYADTHHSYTHIHTSTARRCTSPHDRAGARAGLILLRVYYYARPSRPHHRARAAQSTYMNTIAEYSSITNLQCRRPPRCAQSLSSGSPSPAGGLPSAPPGSYSAPPRSYRPLAPPGRCYS
eukprot:6585211-Pyramimonas_sp.AAC.2